MNGELFRRHGPGPIFTPDDLPFEANAVFNPGVAEVDGEVGLLDLDNPRRVLARASEWVFAPEAEYEQRGLVPNVVHSCGAFPRGDEMWMYYGAADTVIGLAVAKTAELLRFVREHDFLHQVGREKGMAPSIDDSRTPCEPVWVLIAIRASFTALA